MNESAPAEVASGETGEKRTTYVELFFDLVFVFAITQLAGLLKHRHDGAGWVHVALMTWMVWWAWSLYTWAGNAIDLQRTWARSGLLIVTAFTLVFAQAMPQAFAERGQQFAVAYAVVRLAGLALYWYGLRDDAGQRAALLTFLPISAMAAVIVLVGGFVSLSARPWVWALAFLIDFGSTLAAGRGEFHVSPSHFAERHALIVIIALGESIVSVGVAGSELDPTAVRYAAAGSAFVVIAPLWWAYFDWVQGAAERQLVITPPETRGRMARDLFTFFHLPFVVGTVLFAVGVIRCRCGRSGGRALDAVRAASPVGNRSGHRALPLRVHPLARAQRSWFARGACDRRGDGCRVGGSAGTSTELGVVARYPCRVSVGMTAVESLRLHRSP